jgi:hypothetical protein
MQYQMFFLELPDDDFNDHERTKGRKGRRVIAAQSEWNDKGFKSGCALCARANGWVVVKGQLLLVN